MLFSFDKHCYLQTYIYTQHKKNKKKQTLGINKHGFAVDHEALLLSIETRKTVLLLFFFSPFRAFILLLLLLLHVQRTKAKTECFFFLSLSLVLLLLVLLRWPACVSSIVSLFHLFMLSLLQNRYSFLTLNVRNKGKRKKKKERKIHTALMVLFRLSFGHCIQLKLSRHRTVQPAYTIHC